MRVLREESVAVVIDIQEKLFPHIAEADLLLENTIKLITGLQILNVPLIVSEQYTKGLGFTIEPLKNIITNYQPIEKVAFSCADHQPFQEKLQETGRKKVIIFGIESHVCVLQTAIDLIEKNYLPIIVTDCVGSRKQNDKKYALKRMLNEGCLLTTYESILFELCRFSGTDLFKQISRLVK